MTTLTHRRPPEAVAATHAVEVRQTAEAFGDAERDYLHALFAKLILPHTEWHRGTGQSATSTRVSATLAPSPQSTDINQATFQTLGLPQTTAAVQGKAVLLAVALLKREPAPQWAYYFDGVLIRAVANTVPLPPPLSAPSAPGAAIALVDVDDENVREYVDPKADYEAGLLAAVIDKTWRERWAHVTRYWWGRVQSVSVPAKTASVLLDPFPPSAASDTQTCGFGTKAWTAGQLAGHRVRVLVDRQIGWIIDDWA